MLALLPFLAQNDLATCDFAFDQPLVRAAPAVLPADLSAAYPNGVGFDIRATIDRRGNVARAVLTRQYQSGSSAQNKRVRALALEWAKSARWPSSPKPCLQNEWTVAFFPPSSGVVGFPRIVGGVDFANMRYTNGPGECREFRPRSTVGRHRLRRQDGRRQSFTAVSGELDPRELRERQALRRRLAGQRPLGCRDVYGSQRKARGARSPPPQATRAQQLRRAKSLVQA